MCTSTKFKSIVPMLVVVVFMLASAAAFAAESCVQPDNGTGTATLPPIGCEYITPNEPFKIIDGLPAGTTIEMVGILKDFVCCDGPSSCSTCSLTLSAAECETAGGTLSGDGHCFEATLELHVTGTGDLEGYSRTLFVSVFGEMHTGPRNPGDPVQTFANRIYHLSGELFGDPDFCVFRIRGGSSFDYGPDNDGQTVLTELPTGAFAVDSFFDLTYQIEFEGCPGSPLDDFLGTTTETTRMETGFAQCQPKPDGSACDPTACLGIGQTCQPVYINYDPVTGDVNVLECACGEPNDCHIDLPGIAPADGCILHDNGTGTITLPPTGCEYITTDEPFKIIDGLPVGTTIEMDGILKDFICCDGPASCSLCSLSLSPAECETAGGTLGGDGHCFEATLELHVTGTGDLAGYNRTLFVSVFGEMHTGPRNPGDPVQTFANRIYRLSGELFGDPDFCTFRIRGGTYFGYGPDNDGQTILTRLPTGDFAVDSFFDITYQVDFEGCPGSPLDGMAGTTTESTRMETGKPLPKCEGNCPPGMVCDTVMSAKCADGTIDIRCRVRKASADLNRDGIVDLVDFAVLANQWLTPGP
ncbi:MAG: hypothetical protein ABII09_10740 [Planctomycetota bacterium]